MKRVGEFLTRALVPGPGLVAAAIAFFGVLRGQGNADLIWHLALGRHIALTGTIPDINTFYHIPATTAGTDYSWLAQVLFYRLYDVFGGTGLAVLNALVAAGTFCLLYKLLERASRNLLLNVGLLAVSFQLVGPYFGCRPVIFSILFFTFFTYVLSGRNPPRWACWLLPALTALWVNLHPGFLLAPLVVLFFVVFGRGRRLRLLACLGLVVAAVAANPWGLRMYLLPLEMSRSWRFLRGITEWNSPAAVSSAVLCLLLGLTFWLAGRRRKMRPSVAALIIAAGAGIAAVRNLPFAAVAAIWAIGDHLELPAQWPRGLGWMKRFDISIANVGGWLSAIAVPGVLLVLAVLPGRTGPYPLDLSRYPVAALEAVRRENPPGNIFVREEWSGYLLWMMPERRLFHDAKGGFSREASEAHRLLAVPLEGWRTVAERYDIGTFLLHRGTAPVTVLEEAPDWRLLYTDSLAVAYVRVASGESRVPNRDLLEFGTIHRNPKPAARRRGELCVSQEALPSGHAPVLARRSVPGSVP